MLQNYHNFVTCLVNFTAFVYFIRLELCLNDLIQILLDRYFSHDTGALKSAPLESLRLGIVSFQTSLAVRQQLGHISLELGADTNEHLIVRDHVLTGIVGHLIKKFVVTVVHGRGEILLERVHVGQE